MNSIIKFLKSGAGFISQPTHSRTMGMVVMFVLIAAVSLTVIVGQQQQTTKQRATSDYPACKNIEDIPPCAPSLKDGSNFSCPSKDGKCKIDNAIYECQKPQGASGQGD